MSGSRWRLKALFPHARTIYTKRDALDNCLSLYAENPFTVDYDRLVRDPEAAV